MNDERQLTWGDVKNWAEANNVPDDAVMGYDGGEWDLSPVRDLGSWSEPELPAMFILRERKG